MPHIYLDDEEQENSFPKPHILDHTTSYYSQEKPVTNTQNSTVARSRQELMSDIQDTIENLITSIALGEPIKLPITIRKSTLSPLSQQK